jgi:hypothetical protein
LILLGFDGQDLGRLSGDGLGFGVRFGAGAGGAAALSLIRASILIRASRALRFMRTVDSMRRVRLSKVPVAVLKAWARGVFLAGVQASLIW